MILGTSEGMALGDSGFSADSVARAFVGARREGRALAAYPGTAPVDLVQGYQAQDAALGLVGEQVGGWKLGRIAAALEPTYGANRLAGPILAGKIVAEGDGSAVMPIFAEGFGAAEAEFLLHIGTAPDPAKDSYSIAEATALIDAVHVGIEIASSPYAAINADGPAVTASDFGNNNGLVVGAPIAGWREVDLNDWPVETLINGEVIGRGRAADMLDGPFGAAAFLFGLMARRGIALRPGQWISSGAVTGVHPVRVGDRVEARFDGNRSVSCTIGGY